MTRRNSPPPPPRTHIRVCKLKYPKGQRSTLKKERWPRKQQGRWRRPLWSRGVGFFSHQQGVAMWVSWSIDFITFNISRLVRNLGLGYRAGSVVQRTQAAMLNSSQPPVTPGDLMASFGLQEYLYTHMHTEEIRICVKNNLMMVEILILFFNCGAN